MKKKIYKVMIRSEEKTYLKDVNGYFTWLNDVRVFIYYDSNWRNWYVIDIDTGQSFAQGKSMAIAKIDALNNMEKFKNYKATEKYRYKRFLYQDLLRTVK